MLTTEQAKKALDSTKSKLTDIRLDLQSKQKEYSAAEESHAKNVAKNAGRQRYPRSLQVQRESLLKLKMHIEALEKAEEIAEDDLTNAQTTLHLAELYENVAKLYQHSEQVYFSTAQEVKAAVDDLNERTATVCALVDEFLEQSANPVGILRRLINDPALAGLSLGKFIDGEIAKENGGENGHFFDQLATRYAGIVRSLPEVENAQDTLDKMSDNLDSITREVNILVPMYVKHIPQAAPSKPESQAQTGQSLPRHARGGPEIDDDDPRSDKAFFRRRRFQKTIDANTVLGKAKGVRSNV